MELWADLKERGQRIFDEVSIHGFVYVIKKGTSIVERLVWITCIAVGLYSVISLGSKTWIRYQTSPTVISMDRNKFSWNTSFPSLTICPHHRVDEDKLIEYIEERPQIFKTKEDQEEFKIFFKRLSNLTYDSMDTFPVDKSYGISGEDYLELIHNLTWNFRPEISSGTSVKLSMQDTVTEMGLCYSINSVVAPYSSFEYWRNNSWAKVKTNETVVVHPLDGEIYAQVINISSSYEVFFHGAREIPDISKARLSYPETDYTTVELLALEILTTDEARKLSVSQRSCRFTEESETLEFSPVYSQTLCQLECRIKLAFKLCNCIPHFYRKKNKKGKVFPVCDVEGIACLAKYQKDMISLKSKTVKIDCNCEANCDNSNYFLQSQRSRVWFLGANFQFGIIDYPKMQLKRDLLFGFADVLVYVGGLLGLFLGCSLLGLAELIFHILRAIILTLYNRQKLGVDEEFEFEDSRPQTSETLTQERY